MRERRTAIIVDDDYLVTGYLELLCRSFDIDVTAVAHDAETAEILLSAGRPDFVLLDIRLGGPRDGVDLAGCADPGSKIVFITASREQETMDRAMAISPHRVLIKPIAAEALREALH